MVIKANWPFTMNSTEALLFALNSLSTCRQAPHGEIVGGFAGSNSFPTATRAMEVHLTLAPFSATARNTALRSAHDVSP